jgi:PAS domain S-box-containing protein
MDIKLKGRMSGVEAAERIRDRYNLPVIYLTGFADEETLEKAKLTAPFGYLLKPVEATQLHRAIEMALYKHALEHDLQASEEKFRSVVEQSRDGIALIDAHGTFIEWNHSAEAIYGLSRDAVLGQSVWEIWPRLVPADQCPPELIEQMKTAFLAIDAAGQADWLQETHEKEILRPDGTARIVQASVFPIETDDGLMIGVVARDVTQRRRAEAAQARLATIVQDSDDAIFSTTLDGVVTTWNRGAEHIYGYTEGEMVGQSVLRLVPSDREAEVADFLARLRRGERIRHFETERVTKDGARIYVSLSLSPLHGALGDIVGISAVARDVTERHQAEEALRASEREKSIILDAMSEMVAYYDPELRIQWANRASGASLDLTAEDLTGRRCYELWHQRDTPCPNCPVLEAARAKTTQEAEVATPDGRVWLLRGYPILDEAGEVTALVEFGQDITERKRAEEVLQQSHEELEARVAARTAELTAANVRLQEEIAERKRAERTLRRYAEEQAVLYAVASSAASFLKLENLLTAVLDAVLPALDADAGWAVLPAPSDEAQMEIVAWRGIPEDFLSADAEEPPPLCATCTHLLKDEPLMETPSLITDCPRFPTKMLRAVGLHAQVGIPLHVGRRVLGVLAVAWRSPTSVPETNQDLLIAIGQQVGLAVRNAQLYQAAQQVDRLETVNAIGAAVVSSLDLDVVLPHLLGLTCRALDAAEGSILMLDRDTNELVFEQTLAQPGAEQLRGQRLEVGQGIAGWVAQHRQTLCVNDVHEESRWYGGLDESIGFETRSLVCAPLLYHGEVTGVIEVVNKRRGPFTDGDVSLLEAVTTIAASALENARLFTATRDRAEELATLNEIGLALTSTLDSQDVIDAALQQIQRLFQASVVVLLQARPQDDGLCAVQARVNARWLRIPDLPLEPGAIRTLVTGDGGAQVVADVQEDSQWSVEAERYGDLYELPMLHGMMSVPLTAGDRFIGVVLVLSARKGAYDADDLRVVQTLSATLAVALENARLYEELQTSLREQERAQEQLIQAEKMAALGRLAASIAHEINNPLQGVLGCMLLSQEELHGQFRRQKLVNHLEVAVSEVRRVSDIVRRMHDFYRHARTELVTVDVHQVLESVLTLSGKQLQHSDVTVVRDYAPDLSPIQANPDHLKQVFLNLVLNAVDAMPDGGTLRVATRNRPDAEPPAVQIAFHDTGEGMPPEVSERLFEPFFTTKGSGSGLGLSISYGIIESHNGQITVDSQEGEGSTLTVELPVTQPE